MFTLIGADGKEYGPASVEHIREWFAQNRLTPEMLARRLGETEWRSLREFVEFAEFGVADRHAAPPVLGEAPAPTASGVVAPERVVFTGHWVEYFKIWIVNVLLTVVTLGIYAAWAKVRKRRYFYANTRVFGHAFDYLANPVNILLGNVIVVGGFVIFSVLNAINPAFSLPWVLAFVVAFPWFVVRALTFNARNSAWRGLRFNFTGRYGESAGVFLGLPLLAPFTLGLLVPFMAKKRKDFLVGRHAYGTTSFVFSGDTGAFYRIYGMAALFFVPTLAAYFLMVVLYYVPAGGPVEPADPNAGPGGLAAGMVVLLLVAGLGALAGTMYFRARIFNYVWNHTALAGNRFAASMRARDLFLLHLGNSVVTFLTLGLLHPWAQVRTAKFKLESLQIVPAGNIDAFVAAAQPPVSALGEAASDFFDFDFGFGL